MFLENQILKLRALEPYDLELLYIWENDTEIWDVGNTLTPYSKYILHQYIENSHRDIAESKQLRLIIELKTIIPHQPIGTIDLFDIDFYNKRAAIGILIAEKQHRNKGFAATALQLIEKYARLHLNLEQLYCNINTDNQNSIRLFQNAGFQISGKFLNWKKTSSGTKDVYFLQHLLEKSQQKT